MRPGGTFRGQLRDLPNVNPILRQFRQQFIFPERILLGEEFAHCFLNAIENLRRAQTVGTKFARLAFNLLFNSGNTDLEKLVEVRAEDRKKLDPLDQRLPLILRFFQDPPVELEPAQLAVDKIFGIAKTLMRALYDLWSGDRIGFLFSSGSGLSFRHPSSIDSQMRMRNAFRLRPGARQFNA